MGEQYLVMRFAGSQHGFLSKLCHFHWRLGSSLSQNNGAQFPTQLLKTCSCTKTLSHYKFVKAIPRMIITLGLLSYLFVSCLGLRFYSPSASCIAVVCFVYLPFFLALLCPQSPCQFPFDVLECYPKKIPYFHIDFLFGWQNQTCL